MQTALPRLKYPWSDLIVPLEPTTIRSTWVSPDTLLTPCFRTWQTRAFVMNTIRNSGARIPLWSGLPVIIPLCAASVNSTSISRLPSFGRTSLQRMLLMIQDGNWQHNPAFPDTWEAWTEPPFCKGQKTRPTPLRWDSRDQDPGRVSTSNNERKSQKTSRSSNSQETWLSHSLK